MNCRNRKSHHLSRLKKQNENLEMQLMASKMLLVLVAVAVQEYMACQASDEISKQNATVRIKQLSEFLNDIAELREDVLIERNIDGDNLMKLIKDCL